MEGKDGEKGKARKKQIGIRKKKKRLEKKYK